MSSLPACLTPEISQPELWMALDAKARKRVNDWRSLMARVFSSSRPLAQIANEANGLQGRRGWSEKTMLRYYYAIREGADWTIFVPKPSMDKALHQKEVGQPPEFIEYWHSLCLENKRKIKPAYRVLVRQWQAGDSIPGYGTWRDWWRKEKGSAPPIVEGFSPPLPLGWTYQNLVKLRPSDAALTVARRGRKALAAHRPLVCKTRVGLLPGQLYMFDDVWHDSRCRFGSKDVRPLELGCMDVASAYQFAWGLRPLMEQDWSKKKSGIKESEMRYLTASILTGTGFHKDGVKLIVEHGTAAIREELARLLYDLSGGLIQVETGGMEGGAFLDQFRGASSGNSRSKALKESLHNLIHNEAAALPAQMGKDRQHSPEQLYGLQHYNQQLMLAAAQLPRKYAEALVFPMPTWDEFGQAISELYALIHDRTDHSLEGWSRNGWESTEFRLGEGFPWQPRSDYLAIPEEQRAAVDALITAPGNTRPVKLSPRQVWSRHTRDFQRLPVWASAMILGDENLIEANVKKSHEFQIWDRSVSPDGPLVYPSLLTDKDGLQRVLPAGETYAVHFNPFAPDKLVVSDASGAVLGTCSQDKRASYLDTKALVRKSGEAAKFEAELLKPLVRAERTAIRAKKKMHETNEAVLAAAKAEGREQIEHTPAAKDVAASVMEEFGVKRGTDNWSE